MFLLLIKGIREGSESKISLCYPKGLGDFPQFFRERGGVILCVCVCVCVCVWRFCGWLSQWWLIFVLLDVDATHVMGVTFENACVVSGKWNVSRIISRLYAWVYKVLRPLPPPHISWNVGSESGLLLISGFPVSRCNCGSQ